MARNPKAVKTIGKFYSVTERHIQIIDEMVEKFGYTSSSEVVRAAISYFYRKQDPPYLQPSANEEVKISKKQELSRIANLPPLEYVKEFIPGALILPGRDGDYVIIHNVANSVVAYPLANIKQAMEKDPEALRIHLRLLNERPVSDLLSPYQNSLLESDYGIIVPDNLVWSMVKSESEGNSAA